MTEQDKKDIKEVLDLLANCLEAEEIDYVPISTDWLAEHDKKVRADAIEEYHKEMHDIVEGDEEFTDWQKHEILMCNDLVLEQLEEQK